MSEKMPESPRVPAEKPDVEDGGGKKWEPGSVLANVMLQQQAADPVEKGPFIPTLENSPRTGRNVSVIKAKLREQESRHSLEIVRIKREHDVKEEVMKAEIIKLRQTVDGLQEKLQKEETLRKDIELKEAQTSKDLLVISVKCGELQGRLDDCQEALAESRGHIETLRKLHEERLVGMRKEFVEIGEQHNASKEKLEQKIRDLEDQLRETRSGSEKELADKLEEWKRKEAACLESIKRIEGQYEKMVEERTALMGELEQIKVQLQKSQDSRDALQVEMEELREYQKMELIQIQEQHAASQRKWVEQLETVRKERSELEEELAAMKITKEELIDEKARNLEKHEESIKVLKEALTVLDVQNKELTNELEAIRAECKEKETVSATLASQVNSLLVERNEAQIEKDNLTEEKSKLETELACKSQALVDSTVEQGSKICKLEDELASMKKTMTEELNDKDAVIKNLESTVAHLKESITRSLEEKNDKIQDLTKKLDEERSAVSSKSEECNRMKEALQDSSNQLQEISAEYESSKQQISKLNLEMARLINEVVNIKEENIQLKSGLGEAVQKGEFYKERNQVLTEQLAKLQREKDEREAELKTDVQEKISLIEYLQNQAGPGTPNEKKRRRFFQQTKSTVTSPKKMENQTANDSAATGNSPT